MGLGSGGGFEVVSITLPALNGFRSPSVNPLCTGEDTVS